MSSRSASASEEIWCPIGPACLLGREPCASALLYFFSKLPHRLLRNCAAFATDERGACVVERSQEFDALAFTLFPQRKSFLQSVFLMVESAGFNGVFDKCLLVWCKLDFHVVQTKKDKGACQAIKP